MESHDLDAFEKLVEEFFEKILKAEIITRTHRGADNLLDLKVGLDGKTALFSCKHQAHTDSAVSRETSALAALITNECDLFIGFYSTAPSAGLNVVGWLFASHYFRFRFPDIPVCLKRLILRREAVSPAQSHGNRLLTANGNATAASNVCPAMIPAINGASPPNCRAMM